MHGVEITLHMREPAGQHRLARQPRRRVPRRLMLATGAALQELHMRAAVLESRSERRAARQVALDS